MTQDELKFLVGKSAVQYVLKHVPKGQIIGVGTGSTVNCFIDELVPYKHLFAGVVSSSEATTARLQAHSIPVYELNDLENRLPIYIDGADEIDHKGHMIKGGGAALTREKIVAEASDIFLCIADESKYVDVLGRFPLPIEVIPMATNLIKRALLTLNGQAVLRYKNDQIVVTDNQQYILDVSSLKITDPCAFEAKINALPGVVTVGLFARRKANSCLLATAQGVKQLDFVS